MSTHTRIDRTPKPCLHPKAHHTHGTHVTYALDKCRCPPCARANSAYERARVRSLAYGRPSMVEAAPVREHLRALMGAGMGLKRIALAARVSPSAAGKLMYGEPSRGSAPSRRVRASTATALLAVRLTLAERSSVEVTATARRLQGLVADGWTQTYLAARLGLQAGNLNSTIHARRRAVHVGTEAAVARLAAELIHRRPPTAGLRYAQQAARLHGWAPSAAWDADTIADPAAFPNVTGYDPVLVVQWLELFTRPDGAGEIECAEVVRRLVGFGFTTARVAVATGLEPRKVRRVSNEFSYQARKAAAS